MKRSGKITAIVAIALLFSFMFQMQVFSMKPTRKSTALLAAPTGLTALNITGSSLDLSWSTVSGALGYKVFMATPGDYGYTQLAGTTQTTYKCTNLKAGTSYWFYVQAYNSRTNSPASVHISAVTSQAAPPPTTPAKGILGFATYYYTGDSSSYNSMVANASSIDQIATLTYTTDSQGNITGVVPTDQLNYAGSSGIGALAMVTNNFDGTLAKTLLESSTNRQNLINNLLSQIKAYNYKGVNVDIEGINAGDRSYFTTFMNELYSKLNPLGYEVTADVPAKTSDSSANTWNYAYDYAALSNYADKLIIMAYDEHYPGGTPGAIASIGWVNNVVNYSVTVIPKDKLTLGVAAYGYDWSANGTKACSINSAYSLAAANNAQVQWDDISKSPYFTYTDTAGVSHTVWFENGESVGYKLDLVNSSGLSGIAIWKLGLENSDYWTAVNTKLGR